MTALEINKLIQENEDCIIHWIETGKTKSWIANYLGISINGLNGGLARAGIDYKGIKYQAVLYKKQDKLIEENSDFKIIPWIDENFDYLMDCIVKDVPVSLVSVKLNIPLHTVIADLSSYGLFLKGVSEPKKVKKQIKGYKGPNRIKEILQNEDLDFKQEYTFKDCRFEDTNGLARFDFAVFKYDELQYLIEYDGEQHTKAIEYWGGEEGLAKRIEHDEYKDYYCMINGIPLIRIPHTVDLDALSYRDLDPATSSFVV